MKQIKKHTKDVVGAGITLGVGNVALGAMGQGGMLSGASNMLGVAATAGYASSIMKMTNQYAQTKRPVKAKSGKQYGFGQREMY